jgi:integrase
MKSLSKKSPLTEVLVSYLAEREDLSSNTRSTYPYALRVLTEVTGLRYVEDVEKAKPGDIQRAFDEAATAGKYSRKTLAMAFVLGKGLRRFLRLRELVLADCFDAVRVRVGNNVPEHNVLKPGELEKVIEVLDRAARGDEAAQVKAGVNRHSARHLLAVVLMLGRHGLRIHELAKLKLADVQVDTNGAHVATFRGKGGKLARMALSPEAVAACEKWRSRLAQRSGGFARPGSSTGSSFYCPGPSGVMMSRTTTAASLARVTEDLLGHRVTPHGFRATFISTVISKHGIEKARKLARHSSLTTTQRYSRWEVLEVNDA